MRAVRRRLAPWYLTRPRLWREPIGALDARSVVSRRWGYVYIRVPKAANSTVLGTLLTRFPEPGLDPADIETAKARAVHFRDLGWSERGAVRRLFTFTVVRDPYVRTLSAYLDKFRDGHRLRAAFGAAVERCDGGRVSFRGFCRYLAEGGERDNPHWMRQTRILGIADRIDAIGRVETLAADLEAIAGRIAGSAGGDLVITRAGPLPTGACARLAEHYDDECRQIVASVFAADFERLGYQKEGAWRESSFTGSAPSAA